MEMQQTSLPWRLINKQEFLSPGASSSACLQEDGHGCGKQIGLQEEDIRSPMEKWLGNRCSNLRALKWDIHPLGPSLMTIRQPSSSPSCFAITFATYMREPSISTCLSSACRHDNYKLHFLLRTSRLWATFMDLLHESSWLKMESINCDN